MTIARLTGLTRTLRRVGVIVGGGGMLVAGTLMIVAPGPAFVLIPAGLALLATEFSWARRYSRQLRAFVILQRRRLRRTRRQA